MSEPCGVRVAGPLVPYVEGFWAKLAERGYTPMSATFQVQLMAHVSRWLVGEGLQPEDLTPDRAAQFLQARRAGGYSYRLSPRALSHLLGYLREVGIVPSSAPSAPVTPADELLDAYRVYLVGERGLMASTVRLYEGGARLFLLDRSPSGGVDLERLTASDVTAFVVRECRRRSVASAKCLVTSLRSLLRFLYVEGRITTQLAAAVPGVAGWRGGSLPRALDAESIGRLSDSCDRRTVAGCRDYAILTMLARLGLRAGEVAALQLDDVAWREGEVVIRGKGDRHERLPLPVDVGEALVAYLSDARPQVPCRALFLRVRAPIGGLSSAGVRWVVAAACTRAGLPRAGAHRLRHSAATAMLRGGASLGEVGQVLRQRCLNTTAIYAKVDHTALRSLAPPWPGGAA